MEMKQKFHEDAIFKNSSLFLFFKMSQIKKRLTDDARFADLNQFIYF